MNQALFNLLFGALVVAFVYYLSTLPLPPIIQKFIQVVAVVLGFIVVVNFLSFILGVGSQVAL